MTILDRKPIVLSKNAIALIQIFTKTDDILDASLGVLNEFIISETMEEAAKEFIKQLKGQCTPCFLKALKHEIEFILEDLYNA